MSRRWILPLSNPDVVKFTVTPTASAKTVTLENLTAPYNCFVEWGDGEKSAQITGNTAVSHTYADTKPRQVVIRGVLGGFWNATKISAGKTLVTSVDEVNSRSLVTLAHTFRGCTALTALPETIDAPNVADFSYAFYQCRSITSALPALWLSHPKAAHTSCFTSCFKSLYGQYGTGCSYREYVAAVEGQTYYQKYGTGCPAAVYHSGTSKETYMERYGNHADCPKYAKKSGTLTGTCTKCHAVRNATVEYITCTGGHVVPEVVNTNAWSCGHVFISTSTLLYIDFDTPCDVTYRSGTPSYYSCGQSSLSGTSRCNSSCNRMYISGQSAYYKCKKTNATCPTTNCPYPYANEASMTAAKAAGWA